MHDLITFTIEPLGQVTIRAGVPWAAVSGRVTALFACSLPLAALTYGSPPRSVPPNCPVGTAPLTSGAVLFVPEGASKRYCQRYLRQHRHKQRRERRAVRSAQRKTTGVAGTAGGGWASWQPAVLSAVGSVSMAVALRQPWFALLSVLGLVGAIPNLWRRHSHSGVGAVRIGANVSGSDRSAHAGAADIRTGNLAAQGGGTELPKLVPLAPLLSSKHRFRVPIGLDGSGGITYFDLIADGPHLLIAGTTGSGKSVVLRSVILALAYQLDPDELAIALVDFKGGASFGDCQMLPHVVGTVTDLDTGLADRALAGLRAELARRKRVLLQHQLADISELPVGVLPRLVVVFDEFRALTEELPDAVPQLFRIAAQGRSLGIHLILATQRAAGAVSPEVRANVSARLALRVTDVGDSLDIIDSPLAAALPAVPGRAVLRLGASPPRVIQCALADAAPLPTVRRPDVPYVPAPLSPSLTEQVLQHVVSPTHARAPRAQPPIWLPPLPDLVPLDSLADASSITAVDSATSADCATVVGASGIPFGLGDYPDLQNQTTVVWQPDFGNLGIIGRDSRQRSQALHSIGQAAVRQGWEVHLLDISDPAAASELLSSFLTERRLGLPLTAPSGKNSCALSSFPSLSHGSQPANVLVLVDNAERWRDHYQVSQLITACSEVVAIVISSGSPAMSGFANLIASKLVLLSNDPNEDVLLGVPTKFAGKCHSSGHFPGHSPGRAVWFDAADPTGHGPALVQIATTQPQV